MLQRLSRSAGIRTRRLDAIVETGPVQQEGIVRYADMVQCAGLTGGNHPLPKARGTGKSRVGAEDAVFADLDVVPQMAHGVDDGPGMDMGGPVGGAIDVGIGADDDTVLDDDRASVRNAVIAPPLVLGKTKPLRADHAPRFENHVAADPAAITHHAARVQHRSGADDGIVLNDDIRHQYHARAQPDLPTDHDARANHGIRRYGHGCMNDGRWMEPRPFGGPNVTIREGLLEDGHGQTHIGRGENGQFRLIREFRRQRLADDHARRVLRSHPIQILGVIDEYQIAGLALFDGCNTPQQGIGA